MTQLEDAAAGGQLARTAIYAFADGDEQAALDALNLATEGEVKWAAGYLLSGIREAVLVALKGDHRRLELALKSAADAMAVEDVLMTQVALILDTESRKT